MDTVKWSQRIVTGHANERGDRNGMKSNFPEWNDLCEDGFPSLKEVAACLGVTESAVKNYRSGTRPFGKWERLLKLSQPPEALAYAQRMARGEPPETAPNKKALEVQPEGISTKALTSEDSPETSTDPAEEIVIVRGALPTVSNKERWDQFLQSPVAATSWLNCEEQYLMHLLGSLNEDIFAWKSKGRAPSKAIASAYAEVRNHLERVEGTVEEGGSRAEFFDEEALDRLRAQVEVWKQQDTGLLTRLWNPKLKALQAVVERIARKNKESA